MSKQHKIEVSKWFTDRPDLRALRGPINQAVKRAFSTKFIGTVWEYDGRQMKFVLDDVKRTANHRTLVRATLPFLPRKRTASVEYLEERVLAELRAAGWATGPADETGPVEKNTRAAPVVDKKDMEEEEEEEETSSVVEVTDVPIEAPPPPIGLDMGTHFSHLYERDAQVSLLYSAVRAAVDSQFKSRFHAILCGLPGSGKTEILRSFINMLGPDHVLLLDGPSTTKAGAEQFLMGVERVRPFIFIEEIEKMHPAHMQWLLGLLDERGEIRRTNARDGHVQRDARVLCVATVNDLARFHGLMHGALSSRFSHEIFCPRPDTTVLSAIAHREVEKVGGNPHWVNAAVNHCVVTESTYDPRRVISVCLSGRDSLLDGTYQKALNLNRTLREHG